MKKTTLLITVTLLVGQGALAINARASTHPIKAANGEEIYIDVVEFTPSQAALSDADRAALRTTVEHLRKAHTDMGDVRIAVWSDKAFPKAKGQKLSDADRKLAEKRGEAVEDYLEDQEKVDDVAVYSLADRASWLARTFDTEDAELKAKLGQEGTKESMTREEYDVIRSQGGPSRAVVTFRIKPDQKK